MILVSNTLETNTSKNSFRCYGSITKSPQMEQLSLNWHHTGLGLRQVPSTSFHAWVHTQSSETVSACKTTGPSTLAFSLCVHQIWRQKTICQGMLSVASSGQAGQKIHPASLWKLSFPRPSGQPHTPLPHQCQCITIGAPHYGDTLADKATSRLHCLPR